VVSSSSLRYVLHGTVPDKDDDDGREYAGEKVE
jgi:hypothetical protein